MGTFSALLALCEGNSPVTTAVPWQKPVMRSIDIFFNLRLNKRLSKQSRRRWFENMLNHPKSYDSEGQEKMGIPFDEPYQSINANLCKNNWMQEATFVTKNQHYLIDMHELPLILDIKLTLTN